MGAQAGGGTPLKAWQGTGSQLLQFAAWLVSQVVCFLLPPPAGVSEGQGNVFVLLGRFVVAILAALFAWLTQLWDCGKFTRWWALIAGALLLFTIWGFFAYQGELDAHTCVYLGRPILMGSQLTAAAAQVMKEEPEGTCAKLLADFGSDPEGVWTRESIASVRRGLQILYLADLAAASIAFLAAVQLLYCVSLSVRRRTPEPKTRGW